MATSAIGEITGGSGDLQTLVQTLNNILIAINSLNATLSAVPGITLNSVSAASLPRVANDTAAAAAGVPLDGLYVNSSTFALTMRHV